MSIEYGNPTWIYQDDVTEIKELSTQQVDYFSTFRLGINGGASTSTLLSDRSQGCLKRFISEDGNYECLVASYKTNYSATFEKYRLSFNVIEGKKTAIVNGNEYYIFAPTLNDFTSCSKHFYSLSTDKFFLNHYEEAPNGTGYNVICATINDGKINTSYESTTNYSNSLIYKAFLVRVLNQAPKILVEVDNLGDIHTFKALNYSVTDSNNDVVTIKEYVDDVLLKTYSNIQTPSNREFVIDSVRWDGLKYGNHLIKIEATDSKNETSEKVVTFSKRNPPPTLLPTTSSLKQAITHTKEIEKEINYQCSRLGNYLTEKGIEVLESDKISTLIDKVGSIIPEKHKNSPKWSKGGSWIRASNMNTSRGEPSCVAVGTKIYTIGGIDGIGTVNHNECYNTITNTWSTKANMITRRGNTATSSVETKIYVIGGYCDSSYSEGNNECYDTVSNTWSTKQSLPNRRRLATSGSVGTNIYVISGKTSIFDMSININECYNTVANTWSTKANIPKPVTSGATSVINNNLYVFGEGKTQCYDTVNNSWSSKADMNKSTTSLISGVIGDKIYVLNSNTNECYDIIKDSWLSKNTAPTERKFGGCAVDGNIYTIGGYESNSNLNECYIP